MMKYYSLHKCRRILRNGFRNLQKKGKRQTQATITEYENLLKELEQAIFNKDKVNATHLAKQLEEKNKTFFQKSLFDQLREIAYALAFAIIVAFLIRQFWFELYEVPTGSMRPTIGELDRMVVSKTTFGINMPFRKRPLLFSDDYIKRGGVIVFTVEDMDVPDADMLYFRFIPGKKRYVKRAVGKPGDILYFYGGYIYAISKDGKPALVLADPEYLKQVGLESIDHIPFITFDGKMRVSRPTSHQIFGAVTMKQMNEPVAKLEISDQGKIEGKFFNGHDWVDDRISALKAPHDIPLSYSDLWGIGNYAMARMLTKKQVNRFYGEIPEEEEALAYLELKHTPNLTYPQPEIRQDEMGRIHPMITPFATVIPLKKTHLEAIQKALYTSRFYVENGRAYRYQEGNQRPQRLEYDPKFAGVPDGLYEFYDGIGYKVHFGGIRTKLPANHPLYNSSEENIRKLFNLGIGLNLVFEPIAPYQPYNPQRFAYFRNGDFYVMGKVILKKTDPVLVRFVQNELEKQKNSSREEPYIAFVDHGPPLNEDGTLNTDFIRSFGLKVPENGLVGLGDNYSMSADSRDFGFVPTDNLRGAPSFTFWPPGNRIGPLAGPNYPWFTAPNLIIWTIATIIILLCILWIRKRNNRSLFTNNFIDQEKKTSPPKRDQEKKPKHDMTS